MTKPVLLDVRTVKKSFKNPDKQELLVIDNVNLTLHEGEIVALLGQSGSGKSTLLRIIAGLTAPTAGEVLYQNKSVSAPVPGISMVFQSFALMPWLTVMENVELGLEAQGVARKIRRERALKAIDMIGMDGFESAYPKELSGGMRQRVGFARALVVEPELLLMDEPFSALDVLTAETLRGDLMEIWQDKDSTMKGILFVTHNIEEAIMIADRVLVFASNPGSIAGELTVDIPYPRDSEDPKVQALIDDVYTLMTTAQGRDRTQKRKAAKPLGLEYRLPDVRVAELIGLLEEVNELQERGPVDLPELADEIRLDVNDLFPILDALSVLGFAKVSGGDIAMTPKGKELIAADITDQKIIFAEQLKEYIPLAKTILSMLQEHSNHRVSENELIELLEDYFTPEEAERVLTTMIDWGRYAELFAYDYDSGLLSLEDQH